MEKEKLLKLAAFLYKLPEEKFDLNVIVGEHCGLQQLTAMSCGTTACAIGWCPKVFDDVKWEKDYGIIITRFPLQRDWDTWMEGAEKYFGLTFSEISYLFIQDYYPKYKRTAKDVSIRIAYCARFGFPSQEEMRKSHE